MHAAAAIASSFHKTRVTQLYFVSKGGKGFFGKEIHLLIRKEKSLVDFDVTFIQLLRRSRSIFLLWLVRDNIHARVKVMQICNKVSQRRQPSYALCTATYRLF